MSIKIVFAPPGQGKSYYATHKARKAMEKGRLVFSNYPILTPKGISSRIWKPEYALENIQGAMIIVDEAYRDYNSREYKDFTTEVHTFFATNRHNGLDIILIAQNPARVDMVLREITSEFLFMKKIAIPMTEYPLLFVAYGYLDELSLANRHLGESDTLTFIPFRRKTAKSYDTHFYSNDGEIFEGEPWITEEKAKLLIAKDNYLIWSILRPSEKKRQKVRKIVQCLRCRVGCLLFSVKQRMSMMK